MFQKEKKLMYRFVVILLMTTVVTACSKSDDEDRDNGQQMIARGWSGVALGIDENENGKIDDEERMDLENAGLRIDARFYENGIGVFHFDSETDGKEIVEFRWELSDGEVMTLTPDGENAGLQMKVMELTRSRLIMEFPLEEGGKNPYIIYEPSNFDPN